MLLISKSASGLAGQIGLLSKGTISGSATSLAGAGAAAAPPVGTGATLLVVSDWGSALRVASAKDGRADATDSKPCLEIGCQGNSFGAWLETVCAGEVGTSGMYSSRVASAASGFTSGSASNSKPEALAVGIGTCWDGPDGMTDGAEVNGCAALGSAIRVDGSGAVAAGLAASALRNSPRATRSVPFDCSTLIGLVSTRLAPMRNALATPACPSTTATERALAFEPELRALLNSKLAFCSFSQSTTIASKCCAISFLTAANGSLQHST